MVSVRGYPRRRRATPRHVTIREPFPSGRKLSHEASLGRRIDEVVTGQRLGFTWTGQFKFDIDDPERMGHIYNKLSARTMYVIATTNRTLQEWERNPHVRIGANYGVGIWRDDEGTVYVDDIVIHFGIGDDHALELGRAEGQKYILKVDGKTRSYAFLPTEPM